MLFYETDYVPGEGKASSDFNSPKRIKSRCRRSGLLVCVSSVCKVWIEDHRTLTNEKSVIINTFLLVQAKGHFQLHM